MKFFFVASRQMPFSFFLILSPSKDAPMVMQRHMGSPE